MRAKPSSRGRPVIAVTPGEPGGVGPEITASLFAGYRPTGSVAVVVGSYPVLEPWLDRYGVAPVVVRLRARQAATADLAPSSVDLTSAATGIASASIDLASAAADLAAAATGLTSTAAGIASAPDASRRVGRRKARPRVLVLDTGRRERYTLGRDSRGGGKHSGFALEVACALAAHGFFEGIVTGPLSKNALHLGGYPFGGHTDFLARFFDAPNCQMMMVYRKLRVVPLTRHLPLRAVPAELVAGKILAGLRVVNEALVRDFGVPRPRLAVSGLNPHAGEGDVLGSEETEVIRPALRRARRLGMRVTGPVPGDVLFQHVESGTFDAFITMYHDQGLIPFKMTSKRRGVNVTVGLPIVRTSVDHGVAYDIAGRGVASPKSLEAAYRLAETLVRRRRTQSRTPKGWRWTR